MVKSDLTLLRELAAKALDASSSKYLSIVLVGIFALAGSAMVGFFLGIPPPQIHDEFSYLLAADTFAHGRVTNPTHPMWAHFETLHVIHQPTYMSKFMPAQGAILWLGRILGGHPIVGVWLSMAFMCGAICWMLQAWLPSRWALLGGLFAVIHPNIGIGNYWAQSYWGGALPAAGGALLVGGVRYLMSTPRKCYAITAGLGLALLANSRPYEGLVVSIPVGLGLLAWLLGKNRQPPGIVIRNILLPFALIGILSAGIMAFYNYRVTGNAAQIPYLLHKQRYMMSALFVWQKPPPKPVYHHKTIEDFHVRFEYPPYLEKLTLKGFVKINFAAFVHYFIAVGSVFAISLIGSAKPLVSWAWNDPWGRFALFIYGFFILGMMVEIYSYIHYWAPITALNYLFIVQGLRLWRARSPRVGQFILFGLPILALTVLVMTTNFVVATRDEYAPAWERARLLQRLSKDDERHLILVKYGPHHSYFHEWVYNEADIDASKVVWARAMDFKEDCKLIEYFKGRKLWSLTIDHDESPVRLEPISTESCG